MGQCPQTEVIDSSIKLMSQNSCPTYDRVVRSMCASDVTGLGLEVPLELVRAGWSIDIRGRDSETGLRRRPC